MRLTRRILAPVIAATAIFAGSAALAGTASAAVPAHSASTGSTISPAAATWYRYSSYPTYRACNSEGFNLEIIQYAIGNYRCVEEEGYGGAYTVWELEYQLGHPPGS